MAESVIVSRRFTFGPPEKMEDGTSVYRHAVTVPVGVFVDEKSADDAGRQLRHCLDPDRPEKLSLEQLALVLRMGREKGAHGAMTFLCRDAGYQDPVAVEPEDERAQLQREFIQAQQAMLQMAKRMERAGLLREVA